MCYVHFFRTVGTLPTISVIQYLEPLQYTTIIFYMQGGSTARQCSLLYGISATMAAAGAHPDGLIAHGIVTAMKSGIVQSGDSVVVIARASGTFSGATVQLMTA